MARLRISIVEYLNTAPLVWGFTHGPLQGRYDLSFTVPSQCAEQLARGAVDIAIIPAIEYQRISGLVALPGAAIASKRSVRSLLIVSRVPIAQVRRMALDTSSRSTAALTRILCAERWRIQPEFVDSPPDVPAMLSAADAALVIGDPALRLSEKYEAGEQVVPGVAGIRLYDLVEQWRQWTGHPCVLAIWAARREAATPEVAADFLASKQYGLERIDDIAANASVTLGLSPASLARYLRDNIDYSLDDENLAGLELYFHMAASAGLIPAARPLEFPAAPLRAAVRG